MVFGAVFIMAIISCKECGNLVSAGTASSPHCGKPQIQVPPPLPVQPPPVLSKETTIYSDGMVERGRCHQHAGCKPIDFQD
jgi:hypothetical protein